METEDEKLMLHTATGHRKKSIAELTRCSTEEYREIPKIPLIVMADNIRSMHNIGSLFRTSDAFLVEEIILGGISGCPPHPEISKTALGAEDSVRWRHVKDPYEECCRLKESGRIICVLEQTEGSISLEQFLPTPDRRYVLVLGNEVHGVDQRIADMADSALEIPQCGIKHSLNVSTSGAIALFHFFIALRNEA